MLYDWIDCRYIVRFCTWDHYFGDAQRLKVIKMEVDLRVGNSLDVVKTLPDNLVDLTVTSPPYPGKTQRYADDSQVMMVSNWIEFMCQVTQQLVRVTDGMVIIVVDNPVRDGRYIPAAEELMCRLSDESTIVVERPIIWEKNAPPNRGDVWFSHTYELILAFTKPNAKRVWNWESIATPPKYKSGGRFRQRNSKGERVLGSEYPTNPLTRPRDIVKVTVGGGQMGSPLAHENEAPFPENLANIFVKALSHSGQTVLDPFCGSGTTGAVALKEGRNFIGIDIRPSQIDLTHRRLGELCHDKINQDTC